MSNSKTLDNRFNGDEKKLVAVKVSLIKEGTTISGDFNERLQYECLERFGWTHSYTESIRQSVTKKAESMLRDSVD